MTKTIKKILVLTLVTTSLTACGSGQTAETRMIKQVTDGVEAQSAEIRLRNVKIIRNELSQGILIGTLINWSDQADAITGINIGGISATLSAPKFDLLKNKPVIFVGDSANADAFARIKAVLRRQGSDSTYEPSGSISAGPVVIDVERHQVSINDQLISLPLKEFELLEFLVRNSGRVLTRTQLIDRIWGSDYFGDTKTLDVHVKRLRAKIEKDPANPVYIQTIRGLGYKFES